MQYNNILSSHKGKIMVSPANREPIERDVAHHLGILCRELRTGILNEEMVFNADETIFVTDQHNHKTLSIRGDDEVKYADVFSGDDEMTLLVLIYVGRDASVCPLLMVFKNKPRLYLIQNFLDNVRGDIVPFGSEGVDGRNCISTVA